MLPKYETGGCLRFWYSMYGLDVQTLRIVKEDSEFNFWEANGNQGLYWKEGAVHFDKADFVRLQGETGWGPRGDIAVDDISFQEGYCGSSKNSCDFEHGTCGFVNDDDDTADWNLVKAGHNELFGPSNDHTYHSETGHYFVSNCSSDSTFARLISPAYNSGSSCIRYWHNINEYVTLNIYKRPGEGTEVEQPPLVSISKSDVHDSSWMVGEVSVKIMAVAY